MSTSTSARIIADSVSPAGHHLLKTKCCNRCNEKKTLAEFHRSRTAPDGRQYQCKKCGASRQREYARARGVQERMKRDPELLARELKECLRCLKIKPFSDFSPSVRGWGKKAAYCKPCMSKLRSAHPKHKFYVYNWRRKNHERWLGLHAAHQQRRRSAEADGTATSALMLRLYRRERCYYCREKTPRSERTIDHMIPLARGGKHTISNLVMACRSCNLHKSSRTAKEFIAMRRAD